MLCQKTDAFPCGAAEPGRLAQQLSDPELLLLDLARATTGSVLATARNLGPAVAPPPPPPAQSETPGGLALPPLFLAALDQDQEDLTTQWCGRPPPDGAADTPNGTPDGGPSAHAGPSAVFGAAGSGRTRALANLAANAVGRGGQVR